MALTREQGVFIPTQDSTLFEEVECEEGLFIEQACTAANMSPVWDTRRTPHRQPTFHRLSASSQNISHAPWMVDGSAAVCSRRSWDLFQEKYRSLSEDRYRLGCAAPRPTVRFRLQNSRIPDLL